MRKKIGKKHIEKKEEDVIYPSIQQAARETGIYVETLRQWIQRDWLELDESSTIGKFALSHNAIVEVLEKRNADIAANPSIPFVRTDTFGVQIDDEVVDFFREHMGVRYLKYVSDWLKEIVYDNICNGTYQEWIYERTSEPNEPTPKSLAD